MATGSNKGDFLLGLLVGASVGAAVALLYAPASGSETREQVKSAAGDAVGRAGELASTVKDRAGEVTSTVTSTVKDRASDVAHRAQDVAATVRDKASDVASRVKGRTQDLAAQGQDLVTQGQDLVQGAVGGGGAGEGAAGDNWAAQLPDTGGDKTGRRDQTELQTSDDPDVAADRVNNAMQGSGEEARQIAEGLAQAPGSTGKQSS